MKKFLLSVLAVSLLSGCYSPPMARTIENERVINLSKDQVWTNVMEWFTANQVQIKTVEKDSGIIYAETVYSLPYTGADCGKAGDQMITPSAGQFNVFIREMGKNSVKATVNATFASTFTNPMNNQISAVRCVSLGLVEQTILDAAQKR